MDHTDIQNLITAAVHAAANFQKKASTENEQALSSAVLTLRGEILAFLGQHKGGWRYEQEAEFLLHHGFTPPTLVPVYAALDGASSPNLQKLRNILAGEDIPLPLELTFPGLTIKETKAVFVPPEGIGGPILGNGEGEFTEPKFADRTRELLAWLTDPRTQINGQNLQPRDIALYLGEVTEQMLRQMPYNILTIEKWDLEIAVCDQVENAMFVAHPALTPEGWEETGKQSLEQFNLAVRIVMKQNWRADLLEILIAAAETSSDIDAEIIPATSHRAPNTIKAPLSYNLIWPYTLSHLKREKAWPTQDSGDVSDWKGENWGNIQHNLIEGMRGLPGDSSLVKLIQEKLRKAAKLFEAEHERKPTGKDKIEIITGCGVTWYDADQAYRNKGSHQKTLEKILSDDQLDADKIWRHILLHLSRKIEDSWPTQYSGAVIDWDGEKWWTFDIALRRGIRGLKGKSSLAQLIEEKLREAAKLFEAEHKRKPNKEDKIEITPGGRVTWHDADQAYRNKGGAHKTTLEKILSDEQSRSDTIWKYIWAHLKRTGKWPSEASGDVFGQDGENWGTIDVSLRNGNLGLPRLGGLPEFIALKLHEAAELFEAEYKRKPTAEDKIEIVPGCGATWYDADQAFGKKRVYKTTLEKVLASAKPSGSKPPPPPSPEGQ